VLSSSVDFKYFILYGSWQKIIDGNILFLHFVLQIFAGEDVSEVEENSCTYLNNIRANFTICCRYPTFVIWKWQYNECVDHCSTFDLCCFAICTLQKLDVLEIEDDGDASISAQGLIVAFMLSVGNDTQWLPVITDSVHRCHDQFANGGGDYKCDGLCSCY
jgi:hypothetical protein